MKTAKQISLVVTHGHNIGARVVLGAAPVVIGRSRESGLPLTDPAISRKHLEISLVGEEAHVRVLDGAAPISFREKHETDARVPVRETFVVGSTVIAVVLENAVAPPPDRELTDVRKLLDGVGADVRGLSSVFALVDALENAESTDALITALSNWSAKEVGARGAHVLDEDDVARDASLASTKHGEIVAISISKGSSALVVPTASIGASAIRFDLALDPDDVSITVKRMLIVGARIFAQKLAASRAVTNVREENAELRAQAVGSARAFLGESAPAKQVMALLPKLAASDATVLLLGESGAGKTFVARLIHEAGPREREPLRVVNCAAIPENLVESALFGHERGAFTGADAARPGVFESAGRGTVLLDEVGELPPASQAKLLRVLEDRVFERVGSHKEIPLRARVITATNRDLTEAVKNGSFRSDLFFRISVVSVLVPPLRDRGDDITLLARRMLADLSASAGRRVTDFDADALKALHSYSWPGNVRELRNAIEHALVLGEDSVVRVSDLPPTIRAGLAVPSAPTADGSVKLPARLDWLEERAIEAALKACDGNRTRAAALLGINRVTLYKKLKEATED